MSLFDGPLFIPVDGQVVRLDVPTDARHLVSLRVVLGSGLHRRSGDQIRMPQQWAAGVARKTLAAGASLSDLEEATRRDIVTARRRSTDSLEVDPRSLYERVFLGQIGPRQRLKSTPEIEGLLATPWDLVGHRPAFDGSCGPCAALRQGLSEWFADELGFDPVVIRLLHTELVLARVLPAFVPAPDPGEF